jgi:pyruvate-formate lyase-activating enzyme
MYRTDLLEGVVFSGGEPTIQNDLIECIHDCKKFGYTIGLHTNGDGAAYKEAAPLCDYILLSHFDDKKIELGLQAKSLWTSEVVWNDRLKNWENKKERLK